MEFFGLPLLYVIIGAFLGAILTILVENYKVYQRKKRLKGILKQELIETKNETRLTAPSLITEKLIEILDPVKEEKLLTQLFRYWAAVKDQNRSVFPDGGKQVEETKKQSEHLIDLLKVKKYNNYP